MKAPQKVLVFFFKSFMDDGKKLRDSFKEDLFGKGKPKDTPKNDAGKKDDSKKDEGKKDDSKK